MLESMKKSVGISGRITSETETMKISTLQDIFEPCISTLNTDIIPAIGMHISCGIPNQHLLIEIIRCIFNLVSGKHLLIMETDAFAEQNVRETRKFLLNCEVPLKYDSGFENSMPLGNVLLDSTSFLDLLLWCVNLDSLEPSWAANTENLDTKLPYPWNITRAAKSCAKIRLHAMEALSSLTSSIMNFSPLLRHSIQVPEANNFQWNLC